MYYYYGFGLYIQSEIEIPELISSSNKEKKKDVQIKIGEVPKELFGEDVIQIIRSWGRPDEYLIDIIGIARFHIKNGENITIQPNMGSNWDTIRLFLLDSPFAALLHQRDMLLFRASAIIHKKEVIMFCGYPGMGKSNIVGLFNQRVGTSLYSDTLCIVKPEGIKENKIFVTPSFPVLRLWGKSIDHHFTNSDFNKRAPIRESFEKYNQFFKNDFARKPFPLKQIFTLQRNIETDQIKKVDLTRSIDKIRILDRFLYQKIQLKGIRREKEVFGKLRQISMRLPKIIQLFRPMKGFVNFDEFYQIIKNEL